jgi:hypothetical protein
MYEKNWTARIILSLIVILMLGTLVLGYVRGNRPVAQQQHYEVIPNDRFPG